MKIRFGEVFDENTIKEIHEKDHESKFILPKTNNRLFTIVAEDKEVHAAVIVRLVPEATLVMKNDISKRCKAKSLDYLIQAAVMLLRQQNYENSIVFTNYDGFSEILSKHYGFTKIDASALILKLE